jgi:hypothetical protein
MCRDLKRQQIKEGMTMSSLMQFGGRIAGRKVGLLFQKVEKEPWAGIEREVNRDNFTCGKCGREHPRIYEAWRVPRGMFGCWVVFAYNGEEHVPDLSIPINVEKLPRDAREVGQAWAEDYWHS